MLLKSHDNCFATFYLNTPILKIAVVTKQGISDLKRWEAMANLLWARQAGKLWRRG